MRRTRAVLLIWLVLSLAPAARARPDFSGVWTPLAVKAAAGAGAGVAALPPLDLTVRQTASTISLSRTAFDRVTTMTYTFDGREDTNKTGALTRLTHSRWDGVAFIIEGKMSQVTSQGYAAWTLRESLRLDPNGRLILEGAYTGDDGVVTRSTHEYARKQ